jgi:hypothetical protein
MLDTGAQALALFVARRQTCIKAEASPPPCRYSGLEPEGRHHRWLLEGAPVEHDQCAGRGPDGQQRQLVDETDARGQHGVGGDHCTEHVVPVRTAPTAT